METRRKFLKMSGGLLGAALIPPATWLNSLAPWPVGINLYSVRELMLADAIGTLTKLAQIGYQDIESVVSVKGNYYGLQPGEMKQVTADLGLSLRSGHIRLDDTWEESLEAAAVAGQAYLVVAGLPFKGNTHDRYKQAADRLNTIGETCKKAGITFAYHNGSADFEKVNGEVLYDTLLKNTLPEQVAMELDLGWMVVGGGDPYAYMERYPGRFPLWHIKDIKKDKAESTEFGKGRMDISGLLAYKEKAKVNYCFVEQEEWEESPLISLKYDYDYLMRISRK